MQYRCLPIAASSLHLSRPDSSYPGSKLCFLPGVYIFCSPFTVQNRLCPEWLGKLVKEHLISGQSIFFFGKNLYIFSLLSGFRSRALSVRGWGLWIRASTLLVSQFWDPRKLSNVGHSSNPSIEDVQVDGPGVQCHSQLQGEYKASWGQTRLRLKDKTRNTGLLARLLINERCIPDAWADVRVLCLSGKSFSFWFLIWGWAVIDSFHILWVGDQ